VTLEGVRAERGKGYAHEFVEAAQALSPQRERELSEAPAGLRRGFGGRRLAACAEVRKRSLVKLAAQLQRGAGDLQRELEGPGLVARQQVHRVAGGQRHAEGMRAKGPLHRELRREVGGHLGKELVQRKDDVLAAGVVAVVDLDVAESELLELGSSEEPLSDLLRVWRRLGLLWLLWLGRLGRALETREVPVGFAPGSAVEQQGDALGGELAHLEPPLP